MRRAVILATLTYILFAVAGVTVAGENTFTSGSPDGDQTESTGLGRTVPEATALEATVPDDVEKPVEGTIRIEDAGEPTGKPNKPEHAQGGKKYGKPRVAGKPPGKSKPATGRPDDAGEKGFDGNPGKITLCHTEKVMISVGAPAKPAHLRHGDTLGAC